MVKCLGKTPQTLPTINYKDSVQFASIRPVRIPEQPKRELAGVDVFIYSKETAESLIHSLTKREWKPLPLEMISNRGVRVWPGGHPETFCIDQWRLRFARKERHATNEEVIKVMQQVSEHGYDITGTENLYLFDGAPAYSSAEG